MNRFLIPALTLAASPAFAATGPFFSLRNTDFIVTIAFLVFVGLLLYFKVPSAIGKLLDKVDYCFWWGLNDRRPLKSWSNGRLTLLGDAAHPMLPHLGQGVNQAIEDGVALSMLLEGRSSADVPRLLQTYERLRKPRTDMVQTEARKNGMRYDSLYDSIEQRDHEIRNIAGLRLSLYDYDVEKEVKEAMAESV